MSQHHETFLQFINSNSEDESNDGTNFIFNELSSLMPDAISITRDELNSELADMRLRSAIAVIDLNRNK